MAPWQLGAAECLGTPKATYMPGLAPAIMTIRRAMRLCRFHFSTAAATQMTPTSSSVVFLKYSAATCGKAARRPLPPGPAHVSGPAHAPSAAHAPSPTQDTPLETPQAGGTEVRAVGVADRLTLCLFDVYNINPL